MEKNKTGQTVPGYGSLGGYSAGNYKNSKELSEETEAFSATLKLGGKAIAQVSNRGHGSSNEYRFESREDEKEFTECVKTFYGGCEAEDGFFEELLVRLDMTKIAGFPFGHCLGAVHYQRHYRGEMKWSFTN